jgi:hypothetical protein
MLPSTFRQNGSSFLQKEDKGKDFQALPPLSLMFCKIWGFPNKVGTDWLFLGQ